jgi:hypothetical protein
MNSERQLASSMNPQTQRALNRDQALIYGNNAAYNEFGDVASSMSTDVDPYAQQNEMDGLLAPVPRDASRSVPDGMMAVDFTPIEELPFEGDVAGGVSADGMVPVDLSDNNTQTRAERMAEVAYEQSPELQEQLGRILPQLQASQDRMDAMPSEEPWVSKPYQAPESLLASLFTGLTETVDSALAFTNGMANAAYDDLAQPFIDGGFAEGMLNLGNRAFYGPSMLLDYAGVTGDDVESKSYSASVFVEGSTGVSGGGKGVSASARGLTALEWGFGFNAKGELSYNDPFRLGGYTGVDAELSISKSQTTGFNWNPVKEFTGSVGLAFLGSKTATPNELLGGLTLEKTSAFSTQSAGQGFTLEVTDAYITGGVLPKGDAPRIYYQDFGTLNNELLQDTRGKTYLPQNTHTASGFGFSRDVHADKSAGVSVSQGVNVNAKYDPIEVPAGKGGYFAKTAYGIFRGYNDIYSLSSKLWDDGYNFNDYNLIKE